MWIVYIHWNSESFTADADDAAVLYLLLTIFSFLYSSKKTIVQIPGFLHTIHQGLIMESNSSIPFGLAIHPCLYNSLQ